MKTTLAFAALAFAMAAAPAIAQENLVGLDYFETSSTRTLAPETSQAQYNLSTLEDPVGTPVNQLAVSYGLTNTLMVAGSLQTGGHNATSLGTPSYQVGMLYAPNATRNGWSPALQFQYQGGFDQTLVTRGVLSYDTPILAVGNGVTDRFNLSTNLVATQPFQDAGEFELGYGVGVSYPIVGTPQAGEAPAGSPAQQLQRRTESPLRATLELTGDLKAGGSHYVMPGVFVTPSDTLSLGLGVGLRLAGDEKPLYLQTQVGLSF
jgi:hypothetical protein